ncbi:MAG TPA: ATP-binding protein [Candidatus Omnitrophota bacterium]|nr:ATP-binding protein [Candidatus Omnitrophota bacterium]HPD84294.1 ATP-binding protein [Candidatus Omnitrophota bacterium]HRZ03151.1 ATP-binding protein [Candidatus Omnitrophota bacterium]
MKIKSYNFRFNLIISYLLIVLVSFGTISFFLDRNLEENLLKDIKSSLVNQAYLIENQILPENLRKENTAYLDSLVKILGPKIQCRITLVNHQGDVLADSQETREEVLEMENHANRSEIRSALFGKTGEEIRYSSTLKINMLYIALPVKGAGDEIIGAVRLSLPLASIQKMLLSVRKTVFLSFLLALGLAFVLSLVLTNRIARPINRIIHASRKFSQGDFSHKIFSDSKDEIGELADTLNAMAQNLEDKIKEVEIKNQHLVAILECMVEGIIVVDKTSRIISVNPTVGKIFNVTKQEAQGKLFLEVIRNTDIRDIISSVLENGQFISRELSLLWPVQRIFSIDASAIFEDNTVNGCLLVIHDITEIRRLETMRRDFVANVSHELKTPLTSIKGFVETLLEGALDDKENNRVFLKIIQDHTERLDNLVNDLLSLSHLESRTIVLQKSDFKLRQQVEEIILGFKSQIQKNSIEIRDDLPAGLSVRGDKNRLGQVLTNLIDNAIKFNKEKGSIRIYVQEISGMIKITVEDSGAGIPEKDIPRIFERFYRVDKARSRELGGTGLGLSIVKHIVELHGGEVGVESAEGLGSKFFFTLPA